MGGLPPNAVVVARTESAAYSELLPFDPSTSYPELPPGSPIASVPNPAYQAVRDAFAIAGFDNDRFGTAQWNPLGWLVRPGDRVLLKPNLVKDTHPRDLAGWRYMMTHPSVIRAVCDYVALALRGTGQIWIADAPQTDASWDGITTHLQLNGLIDAVRERGIDIELRDLRQQEWVESGGAVLQRRQLAGDPLGYIPFDLGPQSEFVEHGDQHNYYGADYDRAEVNSHHRDGRHEYLIAATVMHADVVINLPKLKTHKKTGLTASLKNLVGVNGDKNWLPHHSFGDPGSGGDEFPESSFRHSLERTGVRALKVAAAKVPVAGPRLFQAARRAGAVAFGDTETVVRSGNWSGNDTAWRMCLDLNKIVLYGNTDGTMRSALPENRRRYLSLVDGILGGQANGPLNPDPIASRFVLLGTDPAATDAVAARLMHFDESHIPLVWRAFETRGWPVSAAKREDLVVLDAPNAPGTPLSGFDIDDFAPFEPHFGWKSTVL